MAAADCQQPRAAPPSRAVALIVEDEFLIRMLLAEALRQADFDVIEAANGDEALSVLHTSADPDVLITDVRMPGSIDGFALAAYVRRTKPGLKVIITSGHAAPDGAIGLADAFLHKPYELGAIVARLQMLTKEDEAH
jgi:two-component system, response regulator PdtaR